MPSRSRSASRGSTTSRPSAGASAATPSTSTIRRTTSRISTEATSIGCGAASTCFCSSAAVSGRTRRARSTARSASPASWARKGSAMSSTCGATSGRTTGRRGGHSSRTTCHASALGRPSGSPEPGGPYERRAGRPRAAAELGQPALEVGADRGRTPGRRGGSAARPGRDEVVELTFAGRVLDVHVARRRAPAA